MSTIDDLFSELDRHKARYDKPHMMNQLFEHACRFAAFNKIEQTELAMEAIMTWRLARVVVHTSRLYDENPKLAYMDIHLPTPSYSTEYLQNETNEWISYWNRIENDNR